MMHIWESFHILKDYLLLNSFFNFHRNKLRIKKKSFHSHSHPDILPLPPYFLISLFISSDLLFPFYNTFQLNISTVNSSSDMVQYHALSLLYKIKQHDRLAVSKIVQQLSKGKRFSYIIFCIDIMS